MCRIESLGWVCHGLMELSLSARIRCWLCCQPLSLSLSLSVRLLIYFHRISPGLCSLHCASCPQETWAKCSNSTLSHGKFIGLYLQQVIARYGSQKRNRRWLKLERDPLKPPWGVSSFFLQWYVPCWFTGVASPWFTLLQSEFPAQLMVHLLFLATLRKTAKRLSTAAFILTTTLSK